jgi:hypothetical protein
MLSPARRFFYVLGLATVSAVVLGACAGGGTNRPAVPASGGFSVPKAPAAAVPRAPAFAVPPAPNAGGGVRAPLPAAGHAAFFTGEVPLSNGVYYLQFPSSNLFGYYAYLSDSHYVYHFDLGYEYVFDSSDANAVYFYDFPSGHFWYTGANLFPYVYDFTLSSFLYYYPDNGNAGHYTTNPRYFFNFGTGQIITMPPQSIPLLLNVQISWANTAMSASSIALTLDVFDSGHAQIAHMVKSESTVPSSSGVRSTTTDNISASYPQGQRATYTVTVNGGPGAPSPCALANGTGSVVDARSGHADQYPTVSLTCS